MFGAVSVFHCTTQNDLNCFRFAKRCCAPHQVACGVCAMNKSSREQRIRAANKKNAHKTIASATINDWKKIVARTRNAASDWRKRNKLTHTHVSSIIGGNLFVECTREIPCCTRPECVAIHIFYKLIDWLVIIVIGVKSDRNRLCAPLAIRSDINQYYHAVGPFTVWNVLWKWF